MRTRLCGRHSGAVSTDTLRTPGPTLLCRNPSCGIVVSNSFLTCPRCCTLLVSSSLIRRQSRADPKEIKRTLRRPSAYPPLPDGESRNGEWVYPLAEKGNAPKEQLQQAKHLRTLGLTTKAKRQAHCGAMGFPLYRCSRNEQHKFYGAFSCGNRYCLKCGPLHFRRLFAKYERSLGPVVKALVPSWPVEGRRPSSRSCCSRLDDLEHWRDAST